jgi:hypothetical protein
LLVRFAIFLLVCILCVATSTAAESDPERKPRSGNLPKTDSVKAWRKPAVERRRRIIFNNDGNEPVSIAKEPTREALLAPRTAALKGSQVDSIFYCTVFGGYGLFNHHTKIGQVYTSREAPYGDNQAQALLDAGIDPLAVMVDFCKQNKIEIFWSMRMNDTHDGSRTDYGPVVLQANTLKAKHPEYLMGTPDKRPKHGSWTAVDYGRPEIRDLTFQYVEEVCQNYDVDGVELDFFRHPVFFRSTTQGEKATDDERAAMTGLLARIRKMADDVGQRRGRPILIAVRAPDSAEYCRDMGLDLEHWMADDLLDLYIASGSFQLNRWDYSVALGHKYGVKVFPSLDLTLVRDAEGKQARTSELAYRGRAANAWAAKPDGVYLFNFFDPHSRIWHELGSKVGLAGSDKDYISSARGVKNSSAGNLPFEPYLNLETLNPDKPKTIAPGESAEARIRVAETASQLKAAKLTLRLRFQGAPATEHLSVKLNGDGLESPAINGQWLEYRDVAGTIRSGENQVEVALSGKVAGKAAWTDLMLQVRGVESHDVEREAVPASK